MDSVLLEHIKGRLRRRGFNPDTASIEFIRVKDTATAKAIPAYNEYYYLDVQSVPVSLVIESDTHSFNSVDAAGYATFNNYRFHEFSGMIQITQGVAIDLQFIRVIPEENIETASEMTFERESIITRFIQLLKPLFSLT